MHAPLVTLPNLARTYTALLASQRRKSRLRPLLLEALAEEVVLDAARQAGLTVANAELQRAADRFRQRHGKLRCQEPFPLEVIAKELS